MSTKRNAVPRALYFPLELPAAQSAVWRVHQVKFSEWQDFNPTEKMITDLNSEKLKRGCIEMKLDGDSLQVVWQYDSTCGGAPARDTRERLVFALATNEWGIVTYNGRFPVEDSWIYQQTVLNIAYASRPMSEIFMATRPVAEYSQIADLW